LSNKDLNTVISLITCGIRKPCIGSPWFHHSCARQYRIPCL
jgi:hypothetical protein